MTLLSIITPAYNEEKNLPVLRRQLLDVLQRLDVSWEWLIVDDCSTDQTFDVVRAFNAADPRIKCIRLARNHGSHLAVLCGFRHAAGDAAILQTADLQDSPEQIALLIEPWRNGADVVWVTRESGRADPAISRKWAELYYVIMRRTLGLREIPESGGDMVLLDRKVLAALARFNEPSLNILVTISWLGFNQVSVPGVRNARLHGRSSYTFAAKLRLFADTVTYYSARPIRWISLFGILLSLVGFLYATIVAINFFVGHTIEGWSSTMVVILILNGVQMTMFGVMGEYLWRNIDQSRNRPVFIIRERLGETVLIKPDEGSQVSP